MSSAARAIHEGDKTIGEISRMVSFDSPDLESGFAPIAVVPVPPKPISFLDQKLFGFQVGLLLAIAVCSGAAAGIWIGCALYGTTAHAAIIGAIPFLG